MALGEYVLHQRPARLGGEIRVRERHGEVQIGAHEADDLGHLLTHLKHGLLAAGPVGAVEEHRREDGDFLFDDKTISCH